MFVCSRLQRLEAEVADLQHALVTSNDEAALLRDELAALQTASSGERQELAQLQTEARRPLPSLHANLAAVAPP